MIEAHELRKVAREREMEQRRKYGDPYSRNSAGAHKRKNDSRDRRREGKRELRDW
jgi:hypothetical protein